MTITKHDPFKGKGKDNDQDKGKGLSTDVKVPRFFDLRKKFTRFSELPKGAVTYINNLTDLLSDKTANITPIMKKIPTVKNSYLVFYKEFGIVLVFKPPTLSVDNVIDNVLVANAISGAKELNRNIKVLNTIIVTEHDYDRYDNMYNYIMSVFEVYSDKDVFNISVESFINKSHRNEFVKQRFYVDTNIDNVKNFIDSCSPHGVMSRGDVGFMIYDSFETKDQDK